MNFWPPLLWGGHNFLNSNSFLTIFNAPKVPIRGVQVLFKHHKQWSPPFESGLPWTLKCYSCNLIATKEQLKDLTHMFCLWISCHKLYKEGLFSHILTLKYKCHFEMSSTKFNLKAKHKRKENKISWLFFRSFSLMFSYLLTYLCKSIGLICVPTYVGR